MKANFQVKTSDFLNVRITTSNNDRVPIEKRFPKSITISELKNKLELITGGNASTMRLEIYDHSDKFLFEFTSSSDNKLLGSFQIDDGLRIHIVDNFQIYNELNSEPVKKFELTDDEYAKKQNTLKSFLKRNKLGKYAEKVNISEPENVIDETDLKQQITIGSRCLVSKPDIGSLKGTVMYVGNLPNRKGVWTGVKYDEPLGNGDGTWQEIKYFEALPKYGDFVQTKHVKCGDFPEDDYGLNEIDEI